jgi:universal stress protein E
MAGATVAPDFSSGELIESELARITAAMEVLCTAHGLEPHAMRVVQGLAVDLLPRLAAERHADVLVMGAVSRSRLREIFVGSTAERVLDHLPCDVLIVRAPDFREKLPF